MYGLECVLSYNGRAAADVGPGLVSHTAALHVAGVLRILRRMCSITGRSAVFACENYEVERQRYNKQINYPQDSPFFQGKVGELP